MSADTEITMFGRGWASFKGDKIPDGFMPPKDDEAAVQEWIDGFMSAYAEYPDERETGMQALTRIAPSIIRFAEVHQ